MVPYGAGSLSDNDTRVLSKLVEKYLPNEQKVKIENVEGGGGILGMTKLMNSAPDGYTIGYGSVVHTSVLPHLEDVAFTHDSFQPIMKNTVGIPLLLVREDSPWDTFEDLKKYAKENPGKFTYSTTGPGSISNLNMVAVTSSQGIEATNIAYEGGAQGVTALLGGHIDGAIVMPKDAMEHVEAGTLKVLFDFRIDESEYDTATTLKDLGLEPGIEAYSMIYAPKGIPDEELTILSEALKKAQEDPEYLEYLEVTNQGHDYLDPEESQEEATRTFKLAEELLKEIGLIE
nr:tripartite tricarboxylate transporter substrate binding protein [Sporosarcina sp. P13]